MEDGGWKTAMNPIRYPDCGVSFPPNQGLLPPPSTFTLHQKRPMPEVVSSFEPGDTLCNRTYIGLLIAQFFAAFNDQAIHASAMFFAIHTQTLSEASAITLMPMLFYAPWAVFCTLAGYFADRYSKQSSLIFWKIAEVGITGTAFAGFWWGTHGNPSGGTWVVFSTVFLMGMHSAFFVPAKYGVMPEILQPHLLSRANGVLESLSFLAIILGTVFGGVFSFLFYQREWIIGVILLGLAVIGAIRQPTHPAHAAGQSHKRVSSIHLWSAASQPEDSLQLEAAGIRGDRAGVLHLHCHLYALERLHARADP